MPDSESAPEDRHRWCRGSAEVYVRTAVGAVGWDGGWSTTLDRVVEAALFSTILQSVPGRCDLLAQLHGVQYARAGLPAGEAEDLRY